MVDSLDWPPSTAEEMIAWQKVCGIDREIARAIGRTRSTVQQTRKDLGVGPYLTERETRLDPVDVAPKGQGNESQLYAGRRYEDTDEVEAEVAPARARVGHKGILG